MLKIFQLYHLQLMVVEKALWCDFFSLKSQRFVVFSCQINLGVSLSVSRGVATPNLYLASLLTYWLLDYLGWFSWLCLPLIWISSCWPCIRLSAYLVFMVHLWGNIVLLIFGIEVLMALIVNSFYSKDWRHEVCTWWHRHSKQIFRVSFECWTQKSGFVFLGFSYTLLRCFLTVLQHCTVNLSIIEWTCNGNWWKSTRDVWLVRRGNLVWVYL